MAAPGKMPTKEELDTIIRGFVRAVNDHNLGHALEFLSDEVIWEGPAVDVKLVGRDAVGGWMAEMFEAFPDVHYPMDDFEVFRELDGNASLSFWTVVMTMKGTYAGFAPTGKRASTKGVCRYEFKDRAISRHTIVYDEMDVVQQLGLLPAGDSFGYRLLAGMQRLTEPVARRLRS